MTIWKGWRNTYYALRHGESFADMLIRAYEDCCDNGDYAMCDTIRPLIVDALMAAPTQKHVVLS